MDHTTDKQVRELLASSRIAFLATEGEHGPESSMAPYVLYAGNPLLHLSGLARHTKNLRACAQVGLMICTPERDDESVLALPRLSLQGRVVEIEDAAFAQAKENYLQRIPEAEQLFTFADFSLLCLQVERIYWIAGFGSAREISLTCWQQMWVDKQQ
ncbi:MAG: pyridoxamine 5'-phosphate oxidase family protein [Mariprofundus sp.]